MNNDFCFIQRIFGNDFFLRNKCCQAIFYFSKCLFQFIVFNILNLYSINVINLILLLFKDIGVYLIIQQNCN